MFNFLMATQDPQDKSQNAKHSTAQRPFKTKPAISEAQSHQTSYRFKSTTTFPMFMIILCASIAESGSFLFIYFPFQTDLLTAGDLFPVWFLMTGIVPRLWNRQTSPVHLGLCSAAAHYLSQHLAFATHLCYLRHHPHNLPVTPPCSSLLRVESY